MIKQWEALMVQLEVNGDNIEQGTWSQNNLQTFETETGIVLPEDYKEYCQIFGTGRLGNYMRIYCPNIYYSELTLGAIRDEIDQASDPTHSEIMNIEDIKQLLDCAFVFGDNASADIVFWDLRTYQNLDKSYDIYLANSDCFDGEIHKVGRIFYEFVLDFCLGTKSLEILPDEMQPLPEELTRTFTYGSM